GFTLRQLLVMHQISQMFLMSFFYASVSRPASLRPVPSPFILSPCFPTQPSGTGCDGRGGRLDDIGGTPRDSLSPLFAFSRIPQEIRLFADNQERRHRFRRGSRLTRGLRLSMTGRRLRPAVRTEYAERIEARGGEHAHPNRHRDPRWLH